MQVISFISDLLTNMLFACLLLWAAGRVCEVWLNVYERVKKDKEGSQE